MKCWWKTREKITEKQKRWKNKGENCGGMGRGEGTPLCTKQNGMGGKK